MEGPSRSHCRPPRVPVGSAAAGAQGSGVEKTGRWAAGRGPEAGGRAAAMQDCRRWATGEVRAARAGRGVGLQRVHGSSSWCAAGVTSGLSYTPGVLRGLVVLSSLL